MIFTSEKGKSYAANEMLLINRSTGPLNISNRQPFVSEFIQAERIGIWRYLQMMPVSESFALSMGEGMTPLLHIEIDGKMIGVKQEQLSPTGSYKDRGSAVLMAYLHEMGVKKVVQDSSGNAGASIAAYAALHGMHCTIVVPEDTSPAKLRQITQYGAELRLVKGNRQAAAEEALLMAENMPYASHCYHPVFYEGIKTFAFEIAEQSGWNVPETLVLPAGNGTLLLGAEIGFRELFQAGLIGHLPRLIAVQTEKCAPLHAAWSGTPFLAASEPGLAEGIAIAQPVRLTQMLQAVNSSGGLVLKVNEEEIAQTHQLMGKMGYYIEPTSAATIAGLRQYLRTNALPSERIATLFSGHGLKK